MFSKISEKTNAMDWLGCVPAVGTVVGLAEVIYYYGVLILVSCFQGPNNIESIKKKTDDVHREITLLKSRVKAFDANDLNRAAVVTKIDDLIKQSAKLVDEHTNEILKWHERGDAVADKCLQGILRATWVGGIGIFVYKLLKKPGKVS